MIKMRTKNPRTDVIICTGIAAVSLMTSCSQTNEEKKPNIIWLVAEDLSPYLPSFGDSTIATPNLSRLAAEGVCYPNVFDISGVCSPSRAALATGMYPSSIGAHHMRTLSQQPEAREMGLIDYECVPPTDVKMVSEIMRENGYYCTNNAKEDYQFHPSKMAWDESSMYAHWRNRPEGNPFFSIFNFGITHESAIWSPFRNGVFDLDIFPPDRKSDWREKIDRTTEKPLWVSENLDVKIPPYLPQTDLVRKDICKMYSNIIEMDRQVGLLLKQLEEDGLLENTIIVWYGDNGGPLPRQKRLVYDSGIKIPMIIRYPGKENAGIVDSQMISFVDFAPTLLSMAGIRPPGYIQGQTFTGKFKSPEERKYVYAAADRFDECYDMIRAVRDKRYKYLRNFQPEKPYYLPVAYREQMATMKELLRLRDEGGLNEIQMQWFRSEKPEEELFDTEKDPHEINNLATDPAYAEKLTELSKECDRWMLEIGDKGFIPEVELIAQFWPGMIQPVTAMPEVTIANEEMIVSCSTEGASLGYKLSADKEPWKGWRIYKNPVVIPQGDTVKVIAHRIGFKPAQVVVINN